MYLIKRTDQGGGYLTPSGSQHSYTKKLDGAMFFKSESEAHAQCAENERVVPLASVVNVK